MRKHLLGVLALGVLALGFGAPAVLAQYGQNSPVIQLNIDVPWAFTVANTTLPAGQYEIVQIQAGTDTPWEWTIRDVKGMVKVIFSSEPDYMRMPPKTDEATFDVVGGHHYLVALWTTGDTEGYGIAMTNAERRVWKRGTKPTQEKVPMKRK
jgi:hypothetical protein